MATYGKGFGPDFDWQELTSQYWKSFTDMTQQALAGLKPDQPVLPQWQDGLAQWQKLFEGSLGNSDLQNGLDQLLDHGRGYLRFMQELAKNGGQFDAADLRGAAERMVADFKLSNPFLEAFPLQNSPIGDGLQQMLGWMQQAGAPADEEVRSWLNMPAFGMAREYQEQAQEYAKAQVDYRQAMNRYNSLIAQSLEAGVEGFQAKLDERGEQGRGVENLRALYDVFIDALEDAYAEMALTEEFSRAYGDLVDAQSRLRLSTNKMVEQLCRAVGVPTRSEVDTLERRLHEVRRAAKNQAEHPALGELKAELDQLRAQVAALKAARGAGEHDDDDAPKAAAAVTSKRAASSGRKPVVATRSVASTAVRSATTAKAKATTSRSKPVAKSADKPATKTVSKSATGATAAKKVVRKAKEG